MRRVVYTVDATDDLRSIRDYIVEKATDAAAAHGLLTALEETCARLGRSDAILGTARDEFGTGLRSTPRGRYVVYFRYVDEIVLIVHVLHGARDSRQVFETGDDR